MKHLRVLVIILLVFGIEGIAQVIHYPTESWEAYQSYRSSILSNYKKGIDVQQNLFKRRMYSPDDSIMLLEAQHDRESHKPLLKLFYKDNENFFKSEEKDKYVIIVNPVFHFASGSQDTGMVYRNTRGAEIMGNIGGLKRGIGFYSLFTENQELMPTPYQYFTDSLNFVPNELSFKRFKNKGAVDFFQARGYITFNAAQNHIKLKFGHDKNKIGNGYRSLILSDYAPQYLFFKINTDVGKFHYQNLFTQFTDNGPILSNVLYGKRYSAMHRLSFDVRPNINVGINEMVIFDRIDSAQSNQFDFNYLNPVIFYRSIESNLGSRDNSLMALDWHWSIMNRYVFYGQLLLDEFNLKFLKSEPNWWANKYGYQIGAKAFNLGGLKNLDVLVEYNRVRPYTYSHMRPTQSYAHFNQALAHPLGSNFSEGVFDAKYSFNNRLFVSGTLVIATLGRDSSLNGSNYGSNILRSYNTRVTENNSLMFMGLRTNLVIYNIQVSYRLRYNLYVDARYNQRQSNDANTMFFSLGLRINTSIRKFDY
ncbi:MAG: hypothetical protein R2852_09585 [Bacteroidia bacterium]